jgi:ABC-type nitrate/sulfonate/bicarbonate transport system substrate-binding protein
MFRRFSCGIAAAMLGLIVASVPARAQTLVPLHIVTTPTDTGAQVYYAQELGLFKKAGFDVDIAAINSGAAIATAVQGGTYDIGQTSVAALAIGHEKGLPLVIVAPGALYTSKSPTSELIVSSTSPIRTAAELNGKTIAVVGLKGLTQVAVQGWLDQNKGSSANAKFVELTFNEMAAALESGRIDAAFIAEPALDHAIQGGAKIIGHPYDSLGKDFLVGAWFCTSDYAKTHPDVVRKFAAIIAEASIWANTHRAESAQVLAKYTKLSTSSTMVRVAYPDRLLAQQVQPSIDIYVKYGLMLKTFPAADLFSPGADRK